MVKIRRGVATRAPSPQRFVVFVVFCGGSEEGRVCGVGVRDLACVAPRPRDWTRFSGVSPRLTWSLKGTSDFLARVCVFFFKLID